MQQAKPTDAPLTTYCALNVEGAACLFVDIAEYLKKHVNFGGNEGVELASENTLVRLEIADVLLKILLNAECSEGCFALVALF